MSAETQTMDMPGPTKPVAEHAWLKKLIGEWTVESEMMMGPEGPTEKGTGREVVSDFGGLWVVTEGKGTMPGGDVMEYRMALGYDVSFKQYRGCWFATVSSHLWKYEGELSADARTLTLNCVGPNMFKDGETANYRDVIEFIDDDHRTLTSYGQDEKGEWQQFMKARFTRV